MTKCKINKNTVRNFFFCVTPRWISTDVEFWPLSSRNRWICWALPGSFRINTLIHIIITTVDIVAMKIHPEETLRLSVAVDYFAVKKPIQLRVLTTNRFPALNNHVAVRWRATSRPSTPSSADWKRLWRRRHFSHGVPSKLRRLINIYCNRPINRLSSNVSDWFPFFFFGCCGYLFFIRSRTMST